MITGNMPIGNSQPVMAWKTTSTTKAGARVRLQSRKATMVESKRKPPQEKA